MSWVIDPSTGDYVMTNGKPTESTSLIYRAYYRTKARRGAWMHAPDAKWGSDFGAVAQRFNGKDLPKLANIQAQALQPLVDDGSALAVDVSYDPTKQANRNSASLSAVITDAQGVQHTLALPPVGD